MDEKSNKELLDELGIEIKKEETAALTPQQERVIAGFEEIERFVETRGCAPQHQSNDIFERLYAVRLERITAQPEYRDLIGEKLLDGLVSEHSEPPENQSDADILAELGVEAPKEGEITFLRHVKPHKEIQTAEEIANRTACKDFEQFAPLFQKVQSELKQKIRQTRPFRGTTIEQGYFFIVDGLTAYVAEVGKAFKAPNGDNDARLRVIFSNGTESDLLLRSLQRALYKDKAGRRIIETNTNDGPLFNRQE